MKESIASARVKTGIAAAGGVARVAREFNINRGSVYEWIKNGLVPSERCPRIVKLAQGRTSCQELNDKFDWDEAREILVGANVPQSADAENAGEPHA